MRSCSASGCWASVVGDHQLGSELVVSVADGFEAAAGRSAPSPWVLLASSCITTGPLAGNGERLAAVPMPLDGPRSTNAIAQLHASS
jgi:hypothetical protein